MLFIRVALATAFLLPMTAFGKKKIKLSHVESSGMVRAGAISESLRRGESLMDFELNLDSPKSGTNSAHIQIYGSNQADDQAVVLKRAYIKGKPSLYSDLTFGLTKKVLGLENSLPEKQRMTARYSLLYRKLQSYAYIGNELILKYASKSPFYKGRTRYAASLGYAESNDIHSILEIDHSDGPYRYGAWLLLQSDRIDDEKQNVWAGVFSYQYKLGGIHFDTEIAGGVDPFESGTEAKLGDGKQILFYGFKTTFGILLGKVGYMPTKLEPLIQVGHIVNDHTLAEYSKRNLLVGFNYHFTRQGLVALNYELVEGNSRIDLDDINRDESSVVLLTKFFW